MVSDDALKFSDIVGDVDQFFSTHFDRHPMLRAQALSAISTPVLTFEELDELLDCESFGPPYLRVTQHGSAIRESDYTQRISVKDFVLQKPDAGLVVEYLRRGATVTWNSMDHFVPRLRALAVEIGTAFSTSCDVVAFVTSAGQPGFGAHYDPTDVLVLQLEGSKSWKVWERPEGYDLSTGSSVDVSKLGSPCLDSVLQAGDVLYIPHGHPHVAECLDQTSLHISCAIRVRTWLEIVQEVVAQVASPKQSWSEFPALSWADPESLSHQLRRRLTELAADLDSVDVDKRLWSYRQDVHDRSKSQNSPKLLHNLGQIDRIAPHTTIRLPEDFNVEEVECEGSDKLAVRTGGHTILVPATLLPLFKMLQQGGPRELGSIGGGIPEARLVQQAKWLLRAGVLVLA